MVQSADGGGKPPWNCGILTSESDGTTIIIGALETAIPLGNGGETRISFVWLLFSVNVAQITELGDVGGKPREEGERTLISNLYLCLGHEGQRALHKQHPHLKMEVIQYPRFV